MQGRKLTQKQRTNILAPALSGVIAFRMGRANEDHFYAMYSHVLIALQIASLVPRHRHLTPDLIEAKEILEKAKFSQKESNDDFFSLTKEEIDLVDLSFEIYKGLLLTTTLKQVAKAIQNTYTATS